ncbi:MAG: ECF transporter S component, partial [Erysipelotrichaceae bacterium]|nr:ECF transporter S component [Erysipelotrichaceae bacterium]
MSNIRTRKLVYTAMFAVINYVAFTYGKITIPVTAGTSTAIHIANAIVVLSSWFLGPVYGGLSGAIGLSIADLLDPRYITSAPKTFLLKFLIGFISGTVAKHFHLKEKTDRKEITGAAAVSAIAGLGFNVIADPIVGYLYRNYLLGIPQDAAKIIATWVAGATAINAVAWVFVSVILYLALYKSFLPRL